MAVKLLSSGGGSVTIADPASTASNFTLNPPLANGNLVSTGDTASVNTAMLVDGSVTPVKLSQKLTQGTAIASTSGTAIDFTGIPSWAKRITLVLNGVSTSGSTNILFQLGSAAGGIETTGYLSYFGFVNTTTNIGSATSSAGLGIWHGGATDAHYLPVCFHLVSGNTWIQSHAGGFYNGSAVHQQTGGGTKTLAGTLDRIRMITANGTDTFDAGSINILYEG